MLIAVNLLGFPDLERTPKKGTMKRESKLMKDFLNDLFYLVENQAYRETKGSSICCCTSQMVTMSKAEPIQSQKPGASSRSLL